jgi:hypothetical protein
MKWSWLLTVPDTKNDCAGDDQQQFTGLVSHQRIKRLASRPGRCTSRKTVPGTHWIRIWLGRRAGLNTVNEENPFWCRRESNSDSPVI